ncbi:MAG: preprotein translocase subunit YajC [Christensenellales bacterium]|jgi:preprotein translocase YajC subunit
MNLFLQTAGSSWYLYVFLGIMLVFMLVMPAFTQKKRQKQMNALLSSIKPGTKVKTIGGFIGVVVAMNEQENSVIINIGSDKEPVNVKIDKNGIGFNLDMAQGVQNVGAEETKEKESI